MTKRARHISWDDYFMNVAILSSHRSKDPDKQVGACIVNSEKKIVATGYNGFPTGCSDDAKDDSGKKWWSKELKNKYVCHAEANAIMNTTTPIKGCILYCTLFPCNKCTQLLIQGGISEIKYMDTKDQTIEPYKSSVEMLNVVGIKYDKYTPRRPWL
jgi:dCMP deaminase